MHNHCEKYMKIILEDKIATPHVSVESVLKLRRGEIKPRSNIYRHWVRFNEFTQSSGQFSKIISDINVGRSVRIQTN